MKSNLSFQILVCALLMNACSQLLAQRPTYKSPETKEVISKMLKAHGSIEKWRNSPSISYKHDMVDPSFPDDHWLTTEIHDIESRRCYQEWPNDQAILANDGKSIWTVDWKRGNPPSTMSGVSFFFVNLVWITQDERSILELKENTEVDLIEKGKSFITVRLTLKNASPYLYYDLYLDPQTYVLKGAKYTVTSKDLLKAFRLPEDTKFIGPLLKVYLEHEVVDGLMFTTRYDTFKPDGTNYGIHKVWDISLDQKFDESKLVKPANGIVFKGM